MSRSMIAFAGIFMGLCVTLFGLPLWLAILLTFAVAALVGCMNGYLLVRTDTEAACYELP